MSSIICTGNSNLDIAASLSDEPMVSSAEVRIPLQWFAVALTAATLAGCAPSSIVTNKSASLGATRQASLEHARKPPIVTDAPATVIKRKYTSSATNKHAVEQDASHGIASFYWQGVKTASGEKFDAQELTAAHRTLPFGTRLRVTNVATGQAVTVRVNDRGPFIAGRVVDVSYSAAEALGIVEWGIARVKLDVVQ